MLVGQRGRFAVTPKTNRFQLVDIPIRELAADHQAAQRVSQPWGPIPRPLKDVSESRFRKSWGSGQSANEEHDGGGVEEGAGRGDGGLEVLCQSPVAVDPGEEALHDPAARLDGEADRGFCARSRRRSRWPWRPSRRRSRCRQRPSR